MFIYPYHPLPHPIMPALIQIIYISSGSFSSGFIYIMLLSAFLVTHCFVDLKSISMAINSNFPPTICAKCYTVLYNASVYIHLNLLISTSDIILNMKILFVVPFVDEFDKNINNIVNIIIITSCLYILIFRYHNH